MTKKLSIGIIGIRGIPNQYGGYEAAVQELAPRLAGKGHQVTVYCSHLQDFKETVWHGVNLNFQYNPEDKMGSFGQFIYDFNCLQHARKQPYDVVLHMGYTSDSVWHWLWSKRARHLTNMDGMEWRRSKYSPRVQKFLKRAEKWAALHSHLLIADSEGIEQYLKNKYQTPVKYVAYGAKIPPTFDAKHLAAYQLTPHNYDLIIARMEPENNLEMAIEAKLSANDNFPLVIFGNHNAYGLELMEKYGQYPEIRFCQANYHQDTLNSVRHYARYYIHGHSVGGTNPSLLEAMAVQCRILAHDNEFNRGVLKNGGRFFTSSKQLSSYLDEDSNVTISEEQITSNIQRIKSHYNWELICQQYEEACYEVL